MKRIIICCDGTWNTPDQEDHGKRTPSNVVKIARAIRSLDSSDVPQVVYYQEGVGTHGGSDRWLGGGTGLGLSDNMIDAYRFLAHNYVPDDAIFLFGFSRGAYTVRSLVGLIDHAGVLPKKNMYFMQEAYGLYRSLKDIDPEAKAEEEEFLATAKEFREKYECLHPEIEFLGVWDTVGSLGIPVGRFDSLKRYSFHRLHASRLLKRRFQALAIHERRRAFKPAFWKPPKDEPIKNFEQRWFAGVHRNIGGGYDEDGLANFALHWIKDKAIEAGLEFDTTFLANEHFEGRLDGLRESKTGFYHLLGEEPRPIGTIEFGNEEVDPTAIDFARSSPLRHARPKNLVKYCEDHNISI